VKVWHAGKDRSWKQKKTSLRKKFGQVERRRPDKKQKSREEEDDEDEK
jgi:hypothetical protein